MAAELRVTIGGVATWPPKIVFAIGAVEEESRGAARRAADAHPGVVEKPLKHPQLFPLMNASADDLPPHRHRDPAGLPRAATTRRSASSADAMDALVGRRIAEASVHRFIGDVARYLREEIARG